MSVLPVQMASLLLLLCSSSEEEEKVQSVRQSSFVPYIDIMGSLTFQENFRLSRSSFESLYLHLCHQNQETRTLGHTKDLRKALQMTLYMMAGGVMYRTVASLFGEPKATAWRHVRAIRRLILRVRSTYIKYPSHDELKRIATKTKNWGHLTGCVGAIDGTHFPFLAPLAFRKYAANRKGYVSLVMQGICDPSLLFHDVFVGGFGSQHDARILRNSHFYNRQLSGSPLVPKGMYLLGDDAYPIASWLLTPFDREPDQATVQFNKRFARIRLSIERAFGKLKRQFPLLVTNRFSFHILCEFIMIACVLHNITIIDSPHVFMYDLFEPDEECQANSLDPGIDDEATQSDLSTSESRKAGRIVRQNAFYEYVNEYVKKNISFGRFE